ncbi:MAG: hypothetical protein IPK73_16755 [Candidatus Obscuribacter sp.]|nr:hypothetical protein [Candidatus Obscuribacter sp.]
MPISKGLAAFLCLTALLLLGFGNTLTPYFHCDDFLHTAYLYRVFHSDFWLLGTNFFSSWLQDRSFYNFFRPLTELSLALDYSLYEGQARGYHLTNLLLHLLNCLLVFKLSTALALHYQLAPGKNCFLNAFFAAALFAVLGSHSEAVAWILSRSDLVCTVFYLTSLLCFLKSESAVSRKPLFQILAGAAFGLALLTKEMAVSLPFLITLLSFTRPAQGQKQSAVWKTILPYFLLLGFYLVWRSLSIGTIYGSYAGSLGEIMRASIWERWFLSDELLRFFHPFNIDLIDENSPLRGALRLVLAGCGLLVLLIQLSCRNSRNLRQETQLSNRGRLIFTLLAFTLLAALPSLQILGVTANMTGGRIAYLPSVPAVMALSFAVLLPQATTRSASLLRLAGILMLTLLTAINTVTVRINNRAWQAAGKKIEAIGKGLLVQTKALREGQKLVIFNLPDQYQGAHCFTTRDTLAGLLKPPLQENDLNAQIEALDFQPLYSGFISYHDYSLARSRPDLYIVLYFDADENGFRKPPLPVYHNDSRATIIPAGMRDTVYKADSFYKKSRTYKYTIAPPVTPEQFQILEVDCRQGAKGTGRAPERSYIFVDWKQPHPPGNSARTTKPTRRPYIELSQALKQRIYLPVSGYKDWQLTPSIDSLYLTITEVDEKEAAPPELRLLKEAQVAPIITNTAFSNMEMKRSGTEALEITYDICGMKDLYQRQGDRPELFLEVGKPYCYSYHYERRPQDSTPLKAPLLVQKLITQDKGSFKLSPSQFNEDGCYQVRLLLKNQEKVLGMASQPLFITVKP